MGEFQLPAEFKGAPVSAAVKALNMEKASAGIEASFPLIKISGKVWSLQHRGQNYPFMRPDGDGPRGFLDVVFVRIAETKAKTFYEKYKEGNKDRPVCWSNDSITPDPAVGPGRQHPNCAMCPKNKVGSATSDAGKPMKACRDHKRTAVFIDPAIVKTVMDEPIDTPVMLRIPAASLNDFSTFGENMDAQGFPMISFVTRIGFDPKVPYQKLTFQAIRRLNDQECDYAIGLRNDVTATKIINAGEAVIAKSDEPAVPEEKPVAEPVPAAGSFVPASASAGAPANAGAGGAPQETLTNVVDLKPSPPAAADTGEDDGTTVSAETDAKLAALLKS